MSQLLYAYCLVALHVKLTCSNQKPNGTRTTVVSTQGNKTLKDNIACIFGPKQVQTLLDINFDGNIDEDILNSEGKDKQLSKNEESIVLSKECPFTFEGVISSCAHGSGRSATDRQFYFVNSRPCEPSKIMKTVNEVYRQYNVYQSPFVCLKIMTENQNVDINVTPDKRQIFLNGEALMLSALRHVLGKLFESIPSTFKQQNTHFKTIKLKQTKFDRKQMSPSKPDSVENSKTLKRKLGFLERFLSSSKCIKLDNENHCDTIYEEDDQEDIGVTSPDLSEESEVEINDCTSRNIYKKSKAFIVDIDKKKDTNITDKHPDIASEKCFNEDADNENLQKTNSCLIEILTPAEMLLPSISIEDESNSGKEDAEESILALHDMVAEDFDENVSFPTSVISPSEQSESNTSLIKHKDIQSIVINTSMKQIKEILRQNKEKKTENETNSKHRNMFHSEITPGKNELAEQELNREITKEKFSKMEIIGQFNLGFIISKLENDLFIIDQHASDEKYNFETLQKSTVLQSQKLVIPKPLELSTVNESMLMDNIEIFKKNGFTFNVDDEAEATKRIQLTSIPISKNWEFGKEDIEELLFMLEDAPNTMCRPSRVQTMLASRACRKSVMIGTPMTKKNMKKLVENMGTIEQPWNCPHGRPTMRHLVNLDLLDLGDDE